MIKPQVFHEDPKDEKKKQRVVVLQEIVVMSLGNEEERPQKIIDRQYGATKTDKQLEFLSTTHQREVGLLPLVGERVYYCPLWSDHYTLDWACSFTDGVEEKDSPINELEKNWASTYGGFEAAEESIDGQEATSSSVIAWNVNPDYCSDLFTLECKKFSQFWRRSKR